jgi:hypothetical protein
MYSLNIFLSFLTMIVSAICGHVFNSYSYISSILVADGRWTRLHWVAVMWISIIFLSIVACFTGFVGFFRNSRLIVFAYLTMLITLVGLQVGFFVVERREVDRQNATDLLVDTLTSALWNDNKMINKTRPAYETLRVAQRHFKCCGVNSSSEYEFSNCELDLDVQIGCAEKIASIFYSFLALSIPVMVMLMLDEIVLAIQAFYILRRIPKYKNDAFLSPDRSNSYARHIFMK